jgi:peptidoglycan DL-endopeptidase CwlO
VASPPRLLRMSTPCERGPRRAAGGLVAVLLLVAALASTPASNAAPRQAKLDAAKARLMELERDFELVVERYNVVHERLNSIRARMQAAQLDVHNLSRRMQTKRDAAVELARELYKGGGAAGAMDAVFSSRTISDVERRLEYLERSEEAQTEVFERLAADRSVLEQQIAELDEARAQALAAEQRLTALRDEIESKVASQQEEIAELNAAIERAERRALLRAQRARRAAARAAAAAQESVERDRSASPSPDAPTPNAPAPNGGAAAAVQAALSQVGKPYQWGAAGPDSYDCSGLTMWAWAHAGVSLPHSSQMQYAATARVSQSDWQPGDLLFFGSPIHHVGMYVGGGRMVEAPYTGASVRVVSAHRSDYVGAGRP